MLGTFLASLTKIMIGAYAYWRHSAPSNKQRVYFANHSSHLDTMAIWSSLEPELRKITRPVAAKDYWDKGGIRGVIAKDALNVVLIERSGNGEDDPLKPLYEALDQGDSLIIFPEGTRRYEAEPTAFKSGLYHLSRRYPHIEYIPVYIDNTRRSLPKGALLPLPVSCMATFGAPLDIDLNESKDSFLARARQAVIDLSKPEGALPEDGYGRHQLQQESPWLFKEAKKQSEKTSTEVGKQMDFTTQRDKEDDAKIPLVVENQEVQARGEKNV